MLLLIWMQSSTFVLSSVMMLWGCWWRNLCWHWLDCIKKVYYKDVQYKLGILVCLRENSKPMWISDVQLKHFTIIGLAKVSSYPKNPVVLKPIAAHWCANDVKVTLLDRHHPSLSYTCFVTAVFDLTWFVYKCPHNK